MSAWHPTRYREAIRGEEWTSPTVGLAPGYVQANLVVLPKESAYNFLLFCVRNPKPCPLLYVTEVGQRVPASHVALDSNLATDLPKYQVYVEGELVDEPTDASRYWRDDMVAFLLGCSLTFEHALQRAGVPLRHLEADKVVYPPGYVTNQPCEPAGEFAGPLVVGMRPIPHELISKTVEVTSKYQLGHGSPMCIGSPESLGIEDLDRPDFGDSPIMRPGDVPVFWGCGATPLFTAAAARPKLMITHLPEHMYITDMTADTTVSPNGGSFS